MPRYKLIVEYDGTPFCGWQIQADQMSVQGLLTSAIEALSGEKTLVQGAGRTDAGVHARAQVAHVDLAREWDTDTVRDALNAHLRPHPIAVLAATRVADDFHARTSATRRHYLYRIINRRADLTLEAGHAWRVPRPLDTDIAVTAIARSFLHNQVRSMVGSLVAVGEGKWSTDDLGKALEARDRTACGPVAPPDGLYLMKVDY